MSEYEIEDAEITFPAATPAPPPAPRVTPPMFGLMGMAALAAMSPISTGPYRRKYGGGPAGENRGVRKGFGTRSQEKTTTDDRRKARKAERKRRGR